MVYWYVLKATEDPNTAASVLFYWFNIKMIFGKHFTSKNIQMISKIPLFTQLLFLDLTLTSKDFLI